MQQSLWTRQYILCCEMNAKNKSNEAMYMVHGNKYSASKCMLCDVASTISTLNKALCTALQEGMQKTQEAMQCMHCEVANGIITLNNALYGLRCSEKNEHIEQENV